MNTTIQVSDKLGEAIVVVKTEDPDAVEAVKDFKIALTHLLGEEHARAYFNARVVPAMVSHIGAAAPTVVPQTAPYQQPAAPQPQFDPMAQAVQTVQQVFPQAQPVAGPQMPAAAAPFQPQAAVAPTCAHGQRRWVTGDGWKAWMCAAPRETPREQKCKPQYVRD